MAQTGFTPILIYSSSTASNAPAVGNLTNSTLGSELAINITDGKLFYKDNANAIQVIGWKVVPATAGGTGQTSYTTGDLLYASSSTALSKLADVATGNALISGGVGTAPSWGKIGLTTHVSGTLPVANGGTGQTSWTANGVLYASGTGTLATTSTFAFDGSNLGLGVAANANTRFSLYKADNTVYTSGARGYLWQQIYNTSTTSGAYSGIEIGVDGVGNGSLATLAAIDAGSGTTEFAISTRVSNTFADALYIDSSRNIKAVSGNFVVGTSGKGIDFSATPGTGTSELLADYEEGTWTPTNSSAITVNSAKYTKIGRIVICTFDITVGASATTGDMLGLPFNATNPAAGGIVSYHNENGTETWSISIEASGAPNWSFRLGSTQKQLSAGKNAKGMITYSQ